MSTNKWIDRVCAAILACTLLLTLLFMGGESLGLARASSVMGYEARIFDTSRVHTIDIVMDDWESFIETCENEEYTACAVVIDGEASRNVGIRAKGNTSLTTVSSMGSSRYSFKIEFDHYDSAGSYYGLDKLSLNNVIQDTTYMKDYLTYRMMDAFGVDAPLCSYAYITVNGEDWGLYLAVEGVEDAFLQRNYGRDHGALYKPDSSDMGGGRGNGREFDMENFQENGGGDMRQSLPEGMGGFDPSSAPDGEPAGETPFTFGRGGGAGMGDTGGMGSSDVKLQYIDDDPASYSNIFDNAKTDVSAADQARLIRSLQSLGELENLEDILDMEKVLRYFVVHNFVCNGDSYTGTIVHNYYLYEEDGRLSMIPWDYNLAFGTFQAGDAASAVNSPIDSPVSGTDARPMVDWIFSDEQYTELYHQYFSEFLANTDFDQLIDQATALIAPYVERDPTKFYTYEEFETGVAVLKDFCRLRGESAAGQLEGTIPSTASGQSADPSALVDASHITLSDMGSMDNGRQAGGQMDRFSPEGERPDDSQRPAGDRQQPEALETMSQQGQRPMGREQGDVPGPSPSDQGSGGLMLLTLLVLAAGLAAAFKFKR